MLVSGRIAEVRRLAAHLGRVCTSLRTPSADPSHRASHHTLAASRERLLFRRVPIALSLVERGVAQMDRQQAAQSASLTREHSNTAQSTSLAQLKPLARAPVADEDSLTTHHKNAGTYSDNQSMVLLTSVPAMHPSTHSVSRSQNVSRPRARWAGSVLSLLGPLNLLEAERKGLLAEKRGVLQRHIGQLRGKQEQMASASPQRGKQLRTGSSAGDDVDAMNDALRDCEEDLALLQASLIARPFLSAKMWRHLLREEAWIATLQSVDATTANANSAARLRLLRSLVCLSQLTLGVVVDYVQGCEVNRASPRFVVSLPSHAWRKGEAVAPRPAQPESVKKAVEKAASEDSEDPLMGMLLEAMAASPENAVSSTHARRPRARLMRWLPAHASHSVMELAQETLALFSFLIPHLGVSHILSLGKGEAFLKLLVTVQRLAQVVVSVQQDRTEPLTADQEAAREQTLSRLQTVLLHAACEFKEQLVSVCAHCEGGAEAQHAFQPRPPAAALCLVQMDGLYLLRPGEAGSDAVIDHLVVCMFPQLRTNTFDVLKQKAQASSLMAFTTRRHRSHLYQAHSGKADAARYLEGTVIQQARLQNRQLAAALRERRLHDVHMQSLSQLASALTPEHLLGLFQLLVVRAHTAYESTSSREAQLMVCDRSVTAALFVAEALLLSAAVRVGDKEDGLLMSPDQAVRVWLSSVTLWPVLRSRDAMPRAAGHRKASHSEKTALAFLAEFVLRNMASTLAQRLSRASEVKSKADPPLSELRAGTVQALVVGLSEWAAATAPTERGMPSQGNAALHEAVDTTLKLLRQVLLQDAHLWHEVRTWDIEQRQHFERVLLDCLQVYGMLDQVTHDAVESMCYTCI